MSNFHYPRDTSDVTRREKNGTISTVPCPTALCDYNKNMNFVDKFDQHLSSYKIDRKSHKWYHRIFFYFLDASVVNTFVVYKQLELPKLTMKDFRRRIIDGLVSKTFFEKENRSSNSFNARPTSTINKFKVSVPCELHLENSSHQPKRTSRRRCGYCSTKKDPSRTNWMCSMCKVPLCLGKAKNCYQLFHNE